MTRLKLLSFAVVFAFAACFAAPSFAEKVDVKKALEDRPVGKAEAPVTIIEYASLTCPHCAHFNKEILPEVEKQLIETGKAKLVFRDFPLDKFALKAAMMARCAPVDKYMPLISVIFSNQERWTKADDIETSLAQLGVLSGMDEGVAKACMNDAGLEKAILDNMQKAQKDDNIHETPSFRFILNGQNAGQWPEFEEIVKNVGKK